MREPRPSPSGSAPSSATGAWPERWLFEELSASRLVTTSPTAGFGVPAPRCFEVMLVRLVTGCCFEDAERLCGKKVSDTTVRSRRDEWVKAAVFDATVAEALAGYDKIIGLDLSDVAVDGSLHKSPRMEQHVKSPESPA